MLIPLRTVRKEGRGGPTYIYGELVCQRARRVGAYHPRTADGAELPASRAVRYACLERPRGEWRTGVSGSFYFVLQLLPVVGRAQEALVLRDSEGVFVWETPQEPVLDTGRAVARRGRGDFRQVDDEAERAAVAVAPVRYRLRHGVRSRGSVPRGDARGEGEEGSEEARVRGRRPGSQGREVDKRRGSVARTPGPAGTKSVTASLDHVPVDRFRMLGRLSEWVLCAPYIGTYPEDLHPRIELIGRYRRAGRE